MADLMRHDDSSGDRGSLAPDPPCKRCDEADTARAAAEKACKDAEKARDAATSRAQDRWRNKVFAERHAERLQMDLNAVREEGLDFKLKWQRLQQANLQAQHDLQAVKMQSAARVKQAEHGLRESQDEVRTLRDRLNNQSPILAALRNELTQQRVKHEGAITQRALYPILYDVKKKY